MERFIRWPDSTTTDVLRTNYIENPSFETNAAVTAVTGGPTLERVGGPGSNLDTTAGDWRLRVTGATPAVVTTVVPLGTMPVTPGEWAAFSAHINRANVEADGTVAVLQLQWRLGSSIVGSGTVLTFHPLTGGSLADPSTLASVLEQVPAGVDSVRALVRFTSTTAPGTLLPPPEGWEANMDGLILSKGASATAAADAAAAYRFTADSGAASTDGQPYTHIETTIPGHDRATLIAAAGAPLRTGVPLIVYCHGSGGGPNHFATADAWNRLRSWLMTSGWAVVEGTGGPEFVPGDDNWANAEAQAAYLAYIEWARDELDVGPIVILGRSMGGIVASWLAVQSPIAGDVAGLMMNSAVSTFFVGDPPGVGTAITRASAAYFSNIATAYGVSMSDPDWYAQLQVAAGPTAPENWDPAVWEGKRILHLYGTEDTAVPWYPRGGKAMRDLWAGKPLVDDVYVRQGGDHTPANGVYDALSPMGNFLVAIAPSVRFGAIGYFDGDTPRPDVDHLFQWTSTPHASRSTYGAIVRPAGSVSTPRVTTITNRVQDSNGIEQTPAGSSTPTIVYPYASRVAPMRGRITAIYDDTTEVERLPFLQAAGLIAFLTDDYTRLSMVMHVRNLTIDYVSGRSKDYWEASFDFTRVEAL